MKALVTFSLIVFVGALVLAPAMAHAQAGSQTTERRLMDFSRMVKAEGEDISFVDREGNVREGLLIAATADAITMKFVSGEQVFPKSAIASVERMRDGTSDGAVKGALIGALLGGIIVGSGGTTGFFARSVVTYTAIGWMFDVASRNRQPIYRANLDPALTVSIRF